MKPVPIHRLLLCLNLMVLIVPILGLAMLRLYQTILIQQTERRLISEAVLIGEVWREAYLAELDLPPGVSPSIKPFHASESGLYPVEPVLTGHDPVYPPQDALPAKGTPPQGPAFLAGQRIKPVLARAKRFNLTAAKVVNSDGLIVAATGGKLGRSLMQWREVREALAGRYTALARKRNSDSPKPPVWSIQRRGSIRVFVALPIFSGGRVIGAVSMSRTIMGPVQGLWGHRFLLAGAFIGGMSAILLLTLFFSRAISRPMMQLTRIANDITAGREHQPFSAGRWAPQEILVLGRTLDTMTRKLDERARYILEYTANVSHELKTPITSIRGAVELLQEGDMPSTQRDRFLANIGAAVERMQRQVNQLLFLAGIEHGDPATQSIAVVETLQELVAGYAGDIRLEILKDPGLCRIKPVQFESAVGNLISNALRHGMGKPVEVSLDVEGSRFSAAVRDYGAGISPANQEKIFSRFFTTERDRGGTGLGLAVVQAVARANGGDVSMTSSGQGTCFVLWLPLMVDKA